MKLKEIVDYISDIIDSILDSRYPSMPAFIVYYLPDIEESTIAEVIDKCVMHYGDSIQRLYQRGIIEFNVNDVKRILYEKYKDILHKKVKEIWKQY